MNYIVLPIIQVCKDGRNHDNINMCLTIVVNMHGKNVEFGNLIPGKFCFWREILAILRDNVSFRWIFCSFFYRNLWKIHIFDNIFRHILGRFFIFPAWVVIDAIMSPGYKV